RQRPHVALRVALDHFIGAEVVHQNFSDAALMFEVVDDHVTLRTPAVPLLAPTLRCGSFIPVSTARAACRRSTSSQVPSLPRRFFAALLPPVCAPQPSVPRRSRLTIFRSRIGPSSPCARRLLETLRVFEFLVVAQLAVVGLAQLLRPMAMAIAVRAGRAADA